MVTETLISPDIEQYAEYSLVSFLIDTIQTRKTQDLIQRVQAIPSENPGVNGERLNDAIFFMRFVHAGQQRHHDIPPDGEEKRDFITHTLGATLMVYELIKDTQEQATKEALTDILIASLLHDTIEDGKMPQFGPDGSIETERDVTKEDLLNFGFGKRVADMVEALSNVRDEEQTDTSIKRRKLDKPEYAEKIDEYHHNHPEMKIFEMKLGGDRAYNILDPLIRVKRPKIRTVFSRHPEDGPRDLGTSRLNQLENTEDFLMPKIDNNPRLQAFMNNVVNLAYLTFNRRFQPDNWKAQLSYSQNSWKLLSRRLPRN